MANRSMWVGDNEPPVRLELQDGTDLVDLTTATSIEVLFIGKRYEFSGAGTSINIVDPDKKHTWNLEYDFAEGDTADPDTYQIFVQVTDTGGIKTFSTADTLTITALPAPAGV